MAVAQINVARWLLCPACLVIGFSWLPLRTIASGCIGEDGEACNIPQEDLPSGASRRLQLPGQNYVLSYDDMPWNQNISTVETLNNPPNVNGMHKNEAEIFFIISDVSKLNEATGKIAVYALFQIVWYDPRWNDALNQHVQRKYCSHIGGEDYYESSDDDYGQAQSEADICSKSAIRAWKARSIEGKLSGRSKTFEKSAIAFAKDIGGEGITNVWTPVPELLHPQSVDNPHGLTKVDPYYVANYHHEKDGIRSGQFEAFWQDIDTTEFGVKLKYHQYPFDEQTIELCVRFDRYTEPVISLADFDELVGLSAKYDKESSLSKHLSNEAEMHLLKMGWRASSVTSFVKHEGTEYRVCLQIVMQRKISIIILRFFGPLGMLLFIPFAGFWLPIGQVMPRVATGFISFLALTVFRNIAYNMVPQKSSSLLWIDVAMFSVTELMFGAVVQNILAQIMKARVSSLAAEYMDNVAKWGFPVVSTVLLLFLFILGALQVDAIVIMVVSQIIVSGFYVFLFISVSIFVARLSKIVLGHFINDLSNQNLLHKDGQSLDPNELRMIFKLMDADRSGLLDPNEIVANCYAHGLKFVRTAVKTTEEQHEEFRADVVRVCGGEGVLVDLDSFRTKIGGQMFGGKLVRRMALTRVKAENAAKAAETAAGSKTKVAPLEDALPDALPATQSVAVDIAKPSLAV